MNRVQPDTAYGPITPADLMPRASVPPVPALRVYVAGPMRGYADFNFPAFHVASRALREIGHEVFSPAERDIQKHGDIFHWKDGDESKVVGFSLREALEADMVWIARNGDAIALLPGWEQSKGAQAEAALGHALGLIVEPIHAFLNSDIPVEA